MYLLKTMKMDNYGKVRFKSSIDAKNKLIKVKLLNYENDIFDAISVENKVTNK